MELITVDQDQEEPRWFVVQIQDEGQVPQLAESYPEEELRRLFPALTPLFDNPRFLGCRWEATGTCGLRTIRISVDE